MPSVPYTGTLQVAPQDDAIPRYTADAIPAAFGVNVAQAIEGLGKTGESVGNEIFARGLAMQEVNNHAEAQEATAKFMEAAGDIHAKLNSMQGKDAVDYYANGFKSDLETARKGLRENLSNPAVQKLFDAESLSTVGRTMFNGASVAGAANKRYAISSVEAQIKSQVDLAATSDNESDVRAAKAKISSLSKQRGVLEGQDESSVDEYAKTINSSLDYNTIKFIARTNPIRAEEMLKERKSGMTAQDYDRARIVVDNSNRAVGAVNIAQKVLNSHIGDDGKTDVSFEKMQQEAEDLARRQAPDDAVMQKHTVDTLRGLFNQRVYADKQFRWDNIQTINDGILKGVENVQQLRADPKIAAAIDNLPAKDQLALPNKINVYNAARDKVANQEALTRIQGLRYNDVEAFLNLDPTNPSLHLSQPQIREVLGWQHQDKKNTNDDPRVGRAMGWLRDGRGAELAALGVFRRNKDNPDDYDHLTGTLSSALDLWQEAHGKPPSYHEFMEKIAPQVLQSRPVPSGWPASMWGGTSNEPFFKPDVNSKEYKNFAVKMRQDVVDKGGLEPTDAEVDHAYTRMQLLKLHPPKSSTTLIPVSR